MRWYHRAQQEASWRAGRRTRSLLRFNYLDQIPLTCFRRRIAAERALGIPHQL